MTTENIQNMIHEARKLASIAFADIAGYTAMMQADEQQALQVLDDFREILESEMEAHSGQIVQFFGDGCLLSFDSTLDGLHAAIALQNHFLEKSIPVRIGMHLGDVIFKNNNAFGDGVNVASRIESIAIPGAILLSKTFYDQVRNKTEFTLQSLGDFQFKNVTDKLEVFAVANEGFVIPRPDQMRGKLAPPASPRTNTAERQEWERYQLLEILDAIEEESCVLILGNHAFSRPTTTGNDEIFLPDILNQEYHKLSGVPASGRMVDFYSAAESIARRPGGNRKLMRLADIKWEELGPKQQQRFQRISEIPFDLILSTYPFDLCHQAFESHGIDHQVEFYSFLSETIEPEPFGSRQPLIYNLFGNRRQKESMVLSLDHLYQFFFAVLGARPLPTLIQDKVQRATQLVFLGFSFDDWYMKMLLRVLKVHEKDISYAHPPAPSGLQHDNQLFYESNFKVTFLDRQIDAFVEELHALCQEEGLLRRSSGETDTRYQSLRDLVNRFHMEEAMDQLDDLLLRTNGNATLLRELGEYQRVFHKNKEQELYRMVSSEESIIQRDSLMKALLSLIDRVEASKLKETSV